MNVFRYLSVALILAPSIWACDAADQATRSGWPTLGAPEVTATVILSIGALEGPGAMSQLSSGFMHDDRIFVAGGSGPQIREYDLAGNLIRRLGRMGRGPGEFQHLGVLAPLSPDSVVALDPLLRRVTIFAMDGSYVRSFQLPVPDYGQPEWISEANDGFLIGFSGGLDPRTLDAPQRDSFAIAAIPRHLDQQQALTSIVGSLGGRWWQRTERGGVRAILDGPAPLISARDGIVWATTGDDHVVNRWTGAGWEVVTLSGHDWSAGDIGTTGIPKRLYEQLVAASDGQFWLSDAVTGTSAHRTWRLFSREGELQAFAALPREFRLWHADPGLLLGVRIDDAGVEYVELVRLAW